MSRKPAKASIYEFSRSHYRLELASDWRYFAFFRLLQISPSYWLAHKGEHENLPLEEVARVYERFGEVWERPYWDWWFDTAQFQFGAEQATSVTKLGLTKPQNALSNREIEELGSNLRQYYEQDLRRMGRPATLLLSLPLAGDRRSLLRQVEILLDQAFETTELPRSSAPFPLLRNKIRDKTVDRAIRAVHAQAEYPQETLFAVGGRAKLSPSYAASDNREAMTQLVSRHLLRAFRLAENAARGIYPSLDTLPDEQSLPKFDFGRLQKQLRNYAQLSASALMQIPHDRRSNEDKFAGANRTIAYDEGLMKSLQGRSL